MRTISDLALTTYPGSPAETDGRLRSLASLPRPKGGLPLLGNAHQLDLQHLHRQFEDWAETLGPQYLVYLGGRPLLVLSDTSEIQRILQERPDTFRRYEPIESVTREIEGYGLFSAEGDDWRRMRRLALPAFSLKQLQALHPDLTRITERLAECWQRVAQKGAAIDPLEELRRYTVDVTSQVAFGRDLNTLEHPESDLQEHLGRLFTAINQRINAFVPYWRYFKLPRDYQVERSKRLVRKVMFEMIGEAEALLKRDPARAAAPRTMLEAMLVARSSEDEKSRLTDDEVVANVATFLLAGEDTTANTIAWMLHYLSHHPEVQQKARAEADAVLVDCEVAARFEQARSLRYITAVAHETLRFRAVLPLQFLEANSDVTLGDLHVPKGTALFLLTRRCAMAAQNFGDPTRFVPERWLEAAGECPHRAHNAKAAFAFGGGPRTCPGRALALIECAMVISMVLRKFVVEAVGPEAAVTERFDFTMQPVGLSLRLRPRATQAQVRLAPGGTT
jgi:cytochrome P450